MNTVYQTDRLLLKVLTPDHLRAVLAFQTRNRDWFEPYEPAKPKNFYTYAHQHMILKCEHKLAMSLSTIRFYVFKKDVPSVIIGTVCLHDITRVPYCCCEIGYKFDHEHWHQGYAREAVAKALEIAFFELKLHRAFARVVPENTSSIHLLQSLHFVEEGLEHGCIEIQGAWTDHLRYARLAPAQIPDCGSAPP